MQINKRKVLAWGIGIIIVLSLFSALTIVNSMDLVNDLESTLYMNERRQERTPTKEIAIIIKDVQDEISQLKSGIYWNKILLFYIYPCLIILCISLSIFYGRRIK